MTRSIGTQHTSTGKIGTVGMYSDYNITTKKLKAKTNG